MEKLDRVLARDLFGVLDQNIHDTLNAVTLEDLLTAWKREENSETLMYFIETSVFLGREADRCSRQRESR